MKNSTSGRQNLLLCQAPEPHMSEVRTPLEPESPVRPARASPVEPVRAPKVPQVRAPEVTGIHAPPVPKPEVPILAAESLHVNISRLMHPDPKLHLRLYGPIRLIVRDANSLPKGRGKGIDISKSRLGNRYILK